jgi:hypothetical protein
MVAIALLFLRETREREHATVRSMGELGRLANAASERVDVPTWDENRAG